MIRIKYFFSLASIVASSLSLVAQTDTVFVNYVNTSSNEFFFLTLYNDSVIVFGSLTSNESDTSITDFDEKRIIDESSYERIMEGVKLLSKLDDPIRYSERVGHFERQNGWSLTIVNKNGAMQWRELRFLSHFEQYSYYYSDQVHIFLRELSQLAKQLCVE